MKNKLFSLTSAVHFGILIYVSKYNMYGKAARLFPDSLAAVLLSFLAFFGCAYFLPLSSFFFLLCFVFIYGQFVAPSRLFSPVS